MMMEYIGYLVLLSTIIITGYCLLKTKVDLKRVIGFASLSAFVGLVLYLGTELQRFILLMVQ